MSYRGCTIAPPASDKFTTMHMMTFNDTNSDSKLSKFDIHNLETNHQTKYWADPIYHYKKVEQSLKHQLIYNVLNLHKV